MTLSFDPAPLPTVPVSDGTHFPVRRVFCVGRNYADHIRELGGSPETQKPVFFTKPADAVVVPTDAQAEVAYPPQTDDLHYEGELVLALKSGGRDIAEADALSHVFGLALGSDQTRRDLQYEMKAKGQPWDVAKAFDESAVMGTITRDAPLTDDLTYELFVNGERRQRAVLSDMITSPAQIIASLSALFELQAGDLIFTGTPEGVGPLTRGDEITVTGAGLAPLRFVMR